MEQQLRERKMKQPATTNSQMAARGVARLQAADTSQIAEATSWFPESTDEDSCAPHIKHVICSSSQRKVL